MTDRHRLRRAAASGERGFVAVTTALVMVMLLVFAALALDVAIFYAKSAQLQRAADAGALAGVTKMPDFAAAQAAATKIATQNRTASGQVTVNTIPNSPRQLKVTVTDSHVPTFFGRFMRNSVSMTRSSIAEYIPKVEMGSQLNAIGTGSIPGWTATGGTQNFWLAINGSCSAREDGDQYGSQWEGNRSAAGVVSCGGPGSFVNQNFRSEGSAAGHGLPTYTYVVDVPCPVANQDPCVTPLGSPVNIEVYNPIFDMSNDPSTIDTNVVDPSVDLAAFYRVAFTTTFQLRTITGDPIVGQNMRSFGSCFQCAGSNGWNGLWTVNAAGRYRIDVSTIDGPDAYGSNAFALRAYATAAGPVVCATAGCPSISGESSMSVYADLAGGQADFYLAHLSPASYYRGKKVQILLFDPGEGAKSIQILAPNAATFSPTGFTWRTWTPNLAGYTNDPGFPDTVVAGPSYELDVSALGSTLPLAQQAPWWAAHPPANDSIFNGRLVSIELQIPPTYGCVAATIPCVETPLPQDGWWKIRYNTLAAGVSDRTTWTVQLIGDPVHLIHNG